MSRVYWDFTSLKRNGFPASPPDYRGAAGPKMGRPSDSRKSGRSRAVPRRGRRRARRQPGELENLNLRVRGATLTPGYADRMPFKFTGKLAKLTIELK